MKNFEMLVSVFTPRYAFAKFGVSQIALLKD